MPANNGRSRLKSICRQETPPGYEVCCESFHYESVHAGIVAGSQKFAGPDMAIQHEISYDTRLANHFIGPVGVD
jgi:hypothetical protein